MQLDLNLFAARWRANRALTLLLDDFFSGPAFFLFKKHVSCEKDGEKISYILSVSRSVVSISANPCNLLLFYQNDAFAIYGFKTTLGMFALDFFSSLSRLFAYYTVSKRSYYSLMKL